MDDQPRGNFMMKDAKSHFWHYAILILLIFSGAVVFFSHPEKTIKFQVGALISLAYIFWGIFHHLLEGNLTLKIVIEYSLIGLLSVIFLGGILL